MLYKFFLLIPVLFFSSDQPKLVKVKVSDDITISIPQSWRPMDGLDFSERYPSVRAPLAAYTNEDRNADFSVNISATRWPDADHEIASSFFKASISNMFDRVTVIEEGVREINGNTFVFFEFESRINGSKSQLGNADPVLNYNFVQYLIQPGRTLVFSFHCSRRDRPAWEKTADKMMNSISVKPAKDGSVQR